MKNIILVLLLAVSFSIVSSFSGFCNEARWEEIGGGNTSIGSVLISPDDVNTIYFGSKEGVFATNDAGKSWRNILSVRGRRQVNYLLSDPKDEHILYAATGTGLFRSMDSGKNWERIFKGKDYLERECIALVILPEALYLGTKAGLFVSKDKGRSWHKETGKIGNSQILAITCVVDKPGSIYAAAAEGLFTLKETANSWERIFVAKPTETDEQVLEEDIQDSDEEAKTSGIRYAAIDPNNEASIYLATEKNVYHSRNSGKSWEALPSQGLFGQDIRFLLVSNKSVIYVATRTAIFEYRDGRWKGLLLGLVAKDIRSLTEDRTGVLYIACDSGLFRLNVNDLTVKEEQYLSFIPLTKEPDIIEVQNAAIKYAEVEPEKIKDWRRKAAKKAILPKVSVGLNRDTSDLWHWESGSTTKTEDDCLVRGRDTLDWDVSLSWDLGEIIWNQDQTSIDVRSRLMVQLREEILDEVTKLYFERLRVKAELNSLSIEDRKKRSEKELRLRELTAMLDALTGGYFSAQVLCQ